jgi:hypothetical protein
MSVVAETTSKEFDAKPERSPSPRWIGELLALVYIALIATIANVTGAFYVMFPELGALSHDVFTRPRGTWARAPMLLAITPVLTGLVGTIFTRTLPYGYGSVLLTVGAAIIIIEVLHSPVAPAISAGLLPLVVGIKSWWYAPGIMLGTFLLAGLSIVCNAVGSDARSSNRGCGARRDRSAIAALHVAARIDGVCGARGLFCEVDRFTLYPFSAASGNWLRDAGAYGNLSVGAAPIVAAAGVFSDCRRRPFLLVSLRRWSIGGGLRDGMGNPNPADFQSSCATRTRGRLAAARDE